MPNHKVGDMIKLTRLSLHMSQEDLSEDICSVQTLSRIENGKNSVKSETYQKLMEKMGRNGERNFCSLSMDHFATMYAMSKANEALLKHDYYKLEQYIRQLKPHLSGHVMNRQYIWKNEIIIDYRTGRITKELFQKRMEDLTALTIPNYRELETCIYPFLKEEIMVLMNLATAYRENGNYQKAIRIIFMLINSLNAGYMEKEKADQIKIVLINNLAKIYGEMEEHQAAVHLSKEGIKKIRNQKLIDMLPNLYFELSWNMIQQIEKGERRKDELSLCKRYLRQGYASAAISKNNYVQNAIKDYYSEYFHETIYAYSPSIVGEDLKR